MYSGRIRQVGVICLLALLLALTVAAGDAQSPPNELILHQHTKQPTLPPVAPELFIKAQTLGSVAVIVQLGVSFRPEAFLPSEADAQQQQTNISQAQNRLLANMATYKITNVKTFKYIPYLALWADAATLAYLNSSPEVVSVKEDKALPEDLAESVPLVGAPQAWTRGFSGAGQAVAVLDTGVDRNHAFLQGKVVSEACYSTENRNYQVTSVCPNGQTSQVGQGAGVNCDISQSSCAHGTHVAGITAGRGNAFSGVAKDANVIAVQVFSRIDNEEICGASGAPCFRTFSSDQIQGLERVYELRTSIQIASVNMSLGGGHYTSADACDADNPSVKAAIDNLRAVGIASAISSGNSSFTDGMGGPGCISTAVSVGSTTKDDGVSYFSNSGNWLKLLAPGSDIYSSVPGARYDSFSGTSMAAPHVAGAWAILKSRLPAATVDQVVNALRASGRVIVDTRNNVSTPRIQVNAALDALQGGGGGSGINGRVTYRGQAVGGLTLKLVRYDSNGQGTNVGSATTDGQGKYQFTTAETLPANNAYRVAFNNADNGNDNRYLYSWRGPRVTSYTAGTSAAGGDFDIVDLPLLNPNDNTARPLPITFSWTPRGISGDQYRLRITATSGNPFWLSPDATASGSYTVNAKPDPLSFNTPYDWYVLVLNGDGFGLSFGTNQVNIAPGGPGPTPATPTRTLTPPPGQGIHGRVTYQGQALSGINLKLYRRFNSQWTEVATGATDGQGRYQFTGAASLTTGQIYRVVFHNSDNNNDTRFVRSWDSLDITSYTAGTSVVGGDFDIANVTHGDPNTTTPRSLPITFNWTPRGVSGDVYYLEIFDPADFDPDWVSDESTTSGSYTLTNKPAVLSFNTAYKWEVVIVNQAGFGLPQVVHDINLAEGGTSARCQVYPSADVPKAIPDEGIVTSTTTVGDSYSLVDVNVVNLNITHTYDSDLQTELISPAGTTILLFNAVGSDGQNFVNTVLDDQADQPIDLGAAPFSGRYRPQAPLAPLNGQNAAGQWQLRISDTAENDVGTLTGWGVELCRAESAPPTPTRTPSPTTAAATRTATPTVTRTPQPGVTPSRTPTPTTTATPGSGGVRVYVSPATASVGVGSTTTIDVLVENVSDLYSYEVHLTFDPTKLQIEGTAQLGSLFAGHTVQTFQNTVNNTTGRVDYAVSLQGEPTGVTGSGSLLKLTVRGVAQGSSPVTLTTDTNLSDGSFNLIPAMLQPGVVTVASGGRVLGRVLLAGRTNHAGASVQAGEQSATTDANGDFSLVGVSGSIAVEARMAGYLTGRRENVQVSSGDVTLPPVTLVGGDTNNDGVINIQDAGLVSRFFGQSIPPADSRADINGDGRVNIQDAGLVSRNFGQRGPTTWSGATGSPIGADPAPRGELGRLVEAARRLFQGQIDKGLATGLSTATTLGFDPSVLTIARDATGVQSVKATGVVDLFSYELHISFDPNTVQVVGTPEPGTVFAGRAVRVFQSAVDNTTGRVDYAVSLEGTTTGFSGDGSLLRLTWRGVNDGVSGLNFTPETALSNSQFTLISATLVEGTVRVGSGVEPTATPENAPAPTETPAAGAAGIYGRVVALGTPLPNAVVALARFDGDNVELLGQTLTGNDGRYQFTNAPSLPFGRVYTPVFYNQGGDARYLQIAIGRLLFEYESAVTRYGGDMEVGAVTLGPPNSSSTPFPLPVTFTWTPRLPGDLYSVDLFGPDDTPSWSDETGTSGGSFTLTQLPPDFQYNTVYTWDLFVLNGETFGLTQAKHQVVFAPGSAGYKLFLPNIRRGD